MTIAKPINLAERRNAIEAIRRNGNRQLYGQLAGRQIQINDELGELVGYANLPSEAAIEVLDFIGWTTAQVWQRAIELALPDAFDFYFDHIGRRGRCNSLRYAGRYCQLADRQLKAIIHENRG